MIELKMFATVYIIGGSLVKYQIKYFPDRCPRRQFQTLILQQCKLNLNLKNSKSFCGKRNAFDYAGIRARVV